MTMMAACVETSAAGLALIGVEDLLCHMLCLRWRWQLFVMNLNTDQVSSSPEPNTTVSGAQD